jgi:hypothetical protein
MRRIMTDRPNSVHTQFIRRKIVPLALLVGLVAGGLSGCIVAAPAPRAYVVPAPVYVAPAPVIVAPAPVVVWGGWGWHRHWR